VLAYFSGFIKYFIRALRDALSKEKNIVVLPSNRLFVGTFNCTLSM